MTKIGKYELISEIGNGSMGSVYLARDPMLDRQVALKRILPGTQLDAELRERFIREARACAKLQHPAIVTIYDLGEEEHGGAYIAMEYLQGTDLRRIIAEKRLIPLVQKVEMICQIGDALHHAHRAGIIHRDIKPSNLFVQNDGRAKIIDFGIARLAASNFTMTGRVLGTPNYMAPEQIQGKPCDGRSDLFSLAIVAFEFLVYSHPFQGDSIPRRIVRENPDSLLVFDPDLPGELGQVIDRALQKDPAQRFANCGAFVQALRRAMGASTAGGTQIDVRVDEALPETEPLPGTEEEQISASARAFDDAVERFEVTHARSALREMERVASFDARFHDLLHQKRERLAELERHASEDQTVLDPIMPPSSAATGAAAPASVRITAPPPAPPPAATSPTKAAPAGGGGGTKAAMALVGVLVLAAVGWFTMRGKGAAELRPAVGTVRVTAAETALAAQPGGAEVGKAARGERLNLLKLPAARTDEWVQVQAVRDGVAQAVAYAKSSDLGDWEAKSPGDQYALLRLFAPVAEANLEDRRAYGERLIAFAGQASPQSGPASLEAAVLFVELARKAAEAKQDAAVVAGLKGLAEKSLSLAEQDPASRDGAATLRKTMASAVAAPPDPQKEIATNLASAQYFHSRGRYAEAEALLMKVLQAQPDNARATQLLQAVRNAKRDEELLFKK